MINKYLYKLTHTYSSMPLGFYGIRSQMPPVLMELAVNYIQHIRNELPAGIYCLYDAILEDDGCKIIEKLYGGDPWNSEAIYSEPNGEQYIEIDLYENWEKLTCHTDEQKLIIQNKIATKNAKITILDVQIAILSDVLSPNAKLLDAIKTLSDIRYGKRIMEKDGLKTLEGKPYTGNIVSGQVDFIGYDA